MLALFIVNAMVVSVQAENEHECKRNGVITFLFDGISKKYTEDVLKHLKSRVKAAFFLSEDDLASSEATKIAKKALSYDNTLGYRTNHRFDDHFHKYCPKKLKAELREAKKQWVKTFDKKLKYVLFPWSEKDCEELYAVAKDENLIVVGHSLYLDPHDGKSTKEIVKRSVRDPSRRSIIAYLNSDLKDQGRITLRVEKYAKKKDFKNVGLDSCLGSRYSRKISHKHYKGSHVEQSGSSSFHSRTDRHYLAGKESKISDLSSHTPRSEARSHASRTKHIRNHHHHHHHRKGGRGEEKEKEKEKNDDPAKAPAVLTPTNTSSHFNPALGIIAVSALVAFLL